jgi:hypothetical protein
MTRQCQGRALIGTVTVAAALMALALLADCRLGGQTAAADPPKAADSSSAKPAAQEAKPTGNSPSAKQAQKPASDPYQWKDLFDGKTLTGWKAAHFGGEGKVAVQDGAIVMEQGSMMTGITWTGQLVRNNYELTLEGTRLAGSDFFCTTPFRSATILVHWSSADGAGW